MAEVILPVVVKEGASEELEQRVSNVENNVAEVAQGVKENKASIGGLQTMIDNITPQLSTYKTSEQIEGGLAAVANVTESNYNVAYLTLDMAKYDTFFIGAENVLAQMEEIQCGAALILKFKNVDKSKPRKYTIVQTCPFIRFAKHNTQYEAQGVTKDYIVNMAGQRSLTYPLGGVSATNSTHGVEFGGASIMSTSADTSKRLWGAFVKWTSSSYAINYQKELPDINNGIMCANLIWELDCVWSETFSTWICCLNFKGSMAHQDVELM